MSDTASPTLETGLSLQHSAIRRLALPSVVLVAAIARLWQLGDAGFGTEYYAASVRSMLVGPHNLFYGAFDPAGILAVDKPPLALWPQVASAWLLGFEPFALMLPQAIEGCLAVIVLWHLVRRDFGEIAGILAALFLAVTPISIAVDRSNNTDSLLVLILLLAAWALPRRADANASWRLASAMALVGVAFNVKMLAAFGVLPAFAASYAFTARASWPRRISHLAASGVALAAVSASWISVVALTPPTARPYIDSTANNSIFDLVVNHNAAQRFLPRAWLRGAPEATGTQPGNTATPGQAALAARNVPSGPARLVDPRLARQAIWLLPLAFAGAVGMVVARRREAAWLWIGWTATYWLVFSFAGGLFSPYYLVLLGPPLAALAGVGVVTLARAWLSETWHRWWLPATLALSFVWQAHIMRSEVYDHSQGFLLLAATIGAVLALAALALLTRSRPVIAPLVALTIGVASLLIIPTAWSIGTVAYEGGRPLARLHPTQDRVGRAAAQEGGEIQALVPFLRENRGDAYLLAATSSARLAAPLIVATGEPVIAFGGFLGTIPVLDGTAMAHLVNSGALRFAIIGGGWSRRARATETDASGWIRAHGTQVDLPSVAPGLSAARFALFDLRQVPRADSSTGPRE
jgi:4-amino-4-deoxy-L-arabinose transferase-like glycosyltransferase